MNCPGLRSDPLITISRLDLKLLCEGVKVITAGVTVTIDESYDRYSRCYCMSGYGSGYTEEGVRSCSACQLRVV